MIPSPILFRAAEESEGRRRFTEDAFESCASSGRADILRLDNDVSDGGVDADADTEVSKDEDDILLEVVGRLG
jgi:hypothetical protein